MSRNFEKLIEYIINNDETRARKMFHEIVVSKSRNIYESFEQMEMHHHGEEEMEDGVEDFIGEVQSEEENVVNTMEADDMDGALDQDKYADLSPADQRRAVQAGRAIADTPNLSLREQLAAVEQNGYAIFWIQNPTEQVQLAAVMKNSGAIYYIKNPSTRVIQALDRQLKKLDEATSDMDDDQGDNMEDRVVDLEDAIEELKAEFQRLMDQDDEDDDMESDDDDMESDDDDMESDDDDMESDDMDADDDDMESDDMDADDMESEDEDMEETLIREYTEKAPVPVRSEHGSVNKKSIVAKKNDMGGTTASIVAGGEEKGRTAPTAKPVGVNDPKAAGRVAFKSHAPKPVTKEVAGVNKDSVLESRKPRNRK